MANRPAKHDERFPTRWETVDGHRRRVRMVFCDKCHFPARMLENSSTPLPPEVVAKKFTQRGWSLNGMNVCPRCLQGKPPMSPAARQAAYCAIRKREGYPMTVAAIRTPTPEERRHIREALDERYNEDAGLYRQSWSDKALGATLDVPAGWVAEIREACGYGPNQNEANTLRSADVEAVTLELAKLQTDLLTRFDELEARLKRLSRDDGRMD